MKVSKDCMNTTINEMLSLLNIRQYLLNKQEDISNECYKIDNRIKRMRNYYGLQIEALKKGLEACDYSAVGELQPLFEEFLKAFEKQYYRKLKLIGKSEHIQDKMFKIVDEILKL